MCTQIFFLLTTFLITCALYCVLHRLDNKNANKVQLQRKIYFIYMYATKINCINKRILIFVFTVLHNQLNMYLYIILFRF